MMQSKSADSEEVKKAGLPLRDWLLMPLIGWSRSSLYAASSE